MQHQRAEQKVGEWSLAADARKLLGVLFCGLDSQSGSEYKLAHSAGKATKKGIEGLC